MNPSNLERIIATAAELGATRALERVGQISGEVSERDAVRLYGSWFRHAVNDGRIMAHRTGNGRNSKKLYSVAAILSLRLTDEATAELKIQ